MFLEGESEFFAQDITFEGDFTIKVPRGWKVTAFQKEGEIFLKKKKSHPPLGIGNISLMKRKLCR